MNGNTRAKNSVSELGKSSGRRGLSFEDFVKYKNRCLDPKNQLDSDHYFYNFNLQIHNANADQVESLRQKRIESETPKLSKSRQRMLVKKATWANRSEYNYSTATTSALISKHDPSTHLNPS